MQKRNLCDFLMQPEGVLAICPEYLQEDDAYEYI